MKTTKKQNKLLDSLLGDGDLLSSLKDKVAILDPSIAEKIAEAEDLLNKANAIKDVVLDLGDGKKDKNETSLSDVLAAFQDVVKKKGLAKIDALNDAVDTVDKAIIQRAEDFLNSAQNFINIANMLPVLPDEIKKHLKTVESWIATGQNVIEKLRAAAQLLDQWAGIVKNWIDKGMTAIDGIKEVGAEVLANAGGMASDIRAFINAAKGLGGGTFQDKIDAAENMLGTLDSLVDKAGDLIGIVAKDENQNNLPDWYDQIASVWDEIGGKDLIKGTDFDDKIIAKITALKGSAERWLSAAMQQKDQLLDKIVKVQEWIQDIQKVTEWASMAKDFLNDVKTGNAEGIYNKLKAMWDGIDNVDDIFRNTDLDNQLLEKVKAIKAKADNFAKLANSFIAKLPGGEKLGNVEDWIKTAIDISARMAKGEDVIGAYIELGKKWVQSGIDDVVNKGKEVTSEIVGQATGFASEVKKFITGAASIKGGDFDEQITKAAEWLKTSEGIFSKADEIIGLVVGDKDGNKLPDWYDKLDEFWKNNLEGKDFLQGTDIDDKILGELSTFKKNVDEWLSKAVEAGENLTDKINIARQWVGTVSNAMKVGAGIVEDIKEGDWASLYDKLIKGWNGIGDIDDILAGVTLDNKILDKVKDFKDKAEAWLANALTGGKANGDISQIKDILGSADQIIRFFLTKHEVEDFSSEFKEDNIIILPPNVERLSPEEEELMFRQLTGGMQAPLINQLGQILTKVNQDMVTVAGQIDASYQKTLNAGLMGCNAYIKAKRQYDSAMKIQKETVAMLRNVLKLAGTVLVSIAAPAAGLATGAVMQTLDLVVTTFEQIDGGDFSAIGDAVGGGLQGAAIQAALSVMMSGGEMNQATELDIQNIFRTGVTEKYEYVKGFVADAQKRLDTIYSNLWKVGQDENAQKQIKSQLLSSVKQWKGIKQQIEDKYINAARDRINENAAFGNFSRALYAGWLINRKPRKVRGEDPMIVKQVIQEMRRFDILKDAGVKWDEKGFGGKVSRFFGWMLGSWASGGYGKKVKELREWAVGEAQDLQDEAAWKRTFAF